MAYLDSRIIPENTTTWFPECSDGHGNSNLCEVQNHKI